MRLQTRLLLALSSCTIQMGKAVSNGHTFECNPSGNFGCSGWKDGHRMSCLEEGPDGAAGKRGYMHWVERPVHTEMYTLRAGMAELKDDVTHYVPGAILNLFVQTNDYNAKYKGFFARAVDSKGRVVGTWHFPGTDHQLFWSPPECGSSHIIHRDAGLKPFRSQLYFEAPGAGTGPITFHALIKQGDPNKGSFWYPNLKKLTLLEAEESEAVLKTAPSGVSCASFCAGQGAGRECDAELMRSAAGNLSTPDGLLAMLGPQRTPSSNGVLLADVICRPPILQSCSPVAPAINKVTGECWYHRQDAMCSASFPSAIVDLPALEGCSGVSVGSDAAVCDVAPDDPDVQRLCICKDGSGRQRFNREAAAAASNSTSKADDLTVAPASSSSSSRSGSSNRLLHGVTAAVAFALSGQQLLHPPTLATTATLIMLAVILPAQPAAAHNWLHTPARAQQKASTTRPCIPRKISDTHQQVGPGQTFMLSWATGHAGDSSQRCLHPVTDVADPKCIPVGKEYTSISIIHEDDYHWLKHEDYQKYFEDYVTNAPVESVHKDPKFARYHGIPGETCGNCDGLGEDKGGIAGFLHFANLSVPEPPPKGSPFHTAGRTAFARPAEHGGDGNDGTDRIALGVRDPETKEELYLHKLTNNSENWLTHEFKQTTNLFRYSDAGIANDRRVSYNSEKHPWLLMAGVYPHIFQRPSDFDAIRIEIPRMLGDRKLKAGHYIVHYRWKGYSDCVDVNVHDAQVDAIDGLDLGKYVWNKIDHCQYVDPKNILTPCQISAASPDKCVQALTGHFLEGACDDDGVVQKAADSGKRCTKRFGVNVVPFKNPATVMFPDQINIPWLNATCSNTPWTHLTGTVTRSETLDWGNFRARATVEGRKCAGSKFVSETKISLREAVAMCTVGSCAGLSYKIPPSGQANDIYNGVETLFASCERVWEDPSEADANDPPESIIANNLVDNVEWNLLVKNTEALQNVVGKVQPEPEDDDIIGVTFGPRQQSGLNLKPIYPEVGNWFYDTGEPFGEKAPGISFGWKCQLGEGRRHATPKVKQAAEARFKELNAACKKPRVYEPCLESGWNPESPPNHTFDYRETSLYNPEYSFCDDGTKNTWSFKVDPGVYRVQAMLGKGLSVGRNMFNNGCTIENNRLDLNKHYYAKRRTFEIEVSDGGLTFSGEDKLMGNGKSHKQNCNGFMGLSFKRIGDQLNTPWLPINRPTDAKGSWVQIELDERAPVGLVSISAPEEKSKSLRSGIDIHKMEKLDCRFRWMLDGDRCQPIKTGDDPEDSEWWVQDRIGNWGSLPFGSFKDPENSGAVVTVSDTACSGSVCPEAGEHRCWSAMGDENRTITTAPYNDQTGAMSVSSAFPWQVSCDGHVGRYLRVWLPGPKRVFDGTIQVNRQVPKIPNVAAERKSNGGGGDCAVKVTNSGPIGSSSKGRQFAGTGKLTVTGEGRCSGRSHENDDGSCCETTLTGLADDKKLGVRCCADRNPFVPRCSSGSTINLALDSRQRSATTSNYTTLESIDFNAKDNALRKVITDRYNDIKNYFENVNESSAISFDSTEMARCENLGDCSYVIDLQADYDVSEIKWIGGEINNAGEYMPNHNAPNSHKFSAWMPNSPLGYADQTWATLFSRSGSGEGEDGGWQEVEGARSTVLSGGEEYFFSPVRTRYIRLDMVEGSGRKLRARLTQIEINGCDSHNELPVVPHLRGENDADIFESPNGKYLFTGSKSNNNHYAGVAYGWHPTGQRLTNENQPWKPMCTNIWGVSGTSEDKHYDDAKDTCAYLGGRLCTAEEVESGCTALHQTKPDTATIWTSSPCSNDASGVCSIKEDEDPLICYGLEARKATDSSTPEYLITDDPLDPVFYSTCYVRESAIDFLPLAGETVRDSGAFASDANANETAGSFVYNNALEEIGSAAEWSFNGMCLTCDNFDENRLDSTAPPTWAVAMEACQDCLDEKDIVPGKCSKEVPATTTSPEVPPECWIESTASCSADDAVLTADECKNALRVAYPEFPISSFTAIESLVLPKGCAGKVIGGGVEGYFNHVGSGSSQAPCTGSEPRKITGTMDSSSIQSSLDVELYPDTNEAVLKMTGPATGWFGFGFDAYRMADTPYTIIIEPETKHVVSEWRLGGHSRGALLESEELRTWMKGDIHWMENGCAPAVATSRSVTRQTLRWEGKFITDPAKKGLVQCCSFKQDDAANDGNDYGMDGVQVSNDASPEEREAEEEDEEEAVQCFRQKQFPGLEQDDGISSQCYVPSGSLVTFDEAEALCKADGKQLCSKDELMQPSASGCCHKGCGGDNPKSVGAWTRDVQTPHDPRLKIVEYSTSDDGAVFSITIVRNMTGETDNHFNFDMSDAILNVIGAKGGSLNGETFLDDCGDGDFDCYHGPRAKVSMQMELFEARSSCVCKQPCTTSTITETSTTTATTTTTTAAAGVLAPLQTVVSFSGVNLTALSSAEIDEFRAAIKSELARSLGVPEGEVDGLVSVILGGSGEASSSTVATFVWGKDTPTSSVDQVQAEMSASTFNVVFNGSSLSADVVETATTPSEGSGGGVVGGVVGGLLAVAIALGASYYYVKIYKVQQGAAGSDEVKARAADIGRSQTNPAYEAPADAPDMLQI